MIVQNGRSRKELGVTTSAQSIEWVTRPGGRRVAYAQFGASDGTPVLFCHGWMASRLTRHPDDRLTASLGVRLVTVDRAGIGQSDPDSAKTLLSSAEDLRAVADELELERFAVLGHSGGGPYAFACARTLPERVARLAIVSGFAPFDRPDAYAGMSSRMRGFVKLLRAAPWLAGPLMRSTPARYHKDPDKAFAHQFGELGDADRAALEDAGLRQSLLDSAVEALAGGHAGVADESRLLFARRWGFSPADVECHVDLWYGTADTIVPADMARYLAQVISDCRLTLLADEGHMLYLTHWSEILRSLTGPSPSGDPGPAAQVPAPRARA
jgi:pimeloyl-ACP methyl ester carboxylesterase